MSVTYSRSERAAQNNAIWCDTICRAHGLATEFLDGLWVCKQPVPRFYPNAVTLPTSDASGSTLARVMALAAENMPARWAIKDSFNTLALEPLGFEPLFTANWMWRDPAPVPFEPPSCIEWESNDDA